MTSATQEPGLLLKVCGVRLVEDARYLGALSPWCVGSIFYPPSPRAVTLEQLAEVRLALPQVIPLIGVVVNATLAEIDDVLAIANGVQLHGDETPDFCAEVRRRHPQAIIIKAVSAVSAAAVASAKDFADDVSFLLFDTPTPKRGGSGQKFGWHLLEAYTGAASFLLSGGIKPEDVPTIRAMSHPRLVGIDVSSSVEAAPGVKDRSKLAALFGALNEAK